jgi:hypothetical protein
MIVEIIPAEGVGKARPIIVTCNQIVIRQDNGTPIGVFAHYGPDGAYAASIAAHCRKCGAAPDDFNRMLQALGVHSTVIVDRLQLPKPAPGARLIAGPQP